MNDIVHVVEYKTHLICSDLVHTMAVQYLHHIYICYACVPLKKLFCESYPVPALLVSELDAAMAKLQWLTKLFPEMDLQRHSVNISATTCQINMAQYSSDLYASPLSNDICIKNNE